MCALFLQRNKKCQIQVGKNQFSALWNASKAFEFSCKNSKIDLFYFDGKIIFRFWRENWEIMEGIENSK